MRYSTISSLVERIDTDSSIPNVYPLKKIKPKRILIIFWGRMGEAILSTMLLQVLRKKFQKAHISYVIGKGGDEILKNDPNIDELIAADAQTHRKLAAGRPYDLAIDLYGGSVSRLMVYLSGARHCVFLPKPHMGAAPLSTMGLKSKRYPNNNVKDHFINILNLLGVSISKKDRIRVMPSVSISKRENLCAKQFLKRLNIGNRDFIVGIQPGRHYELWPESKYAELATKLRERYKAKIIIFNAQGEKTAATRINSLIPGQAIVLPRFNIRDYLAVLSKCDIFITTICGAAHAGPALGVPTAVILSRPQADYWIPDRCDKSFYLPIISKEGKRYEAHTPKGVTVLTVSVDHILHALDVVIK